MAYSEFLNLKQVHRELHIDNELVRLFAKPIKTPALSIFLQNDLLEAQDTPLLSEKAKSEAVIAPILREVKRQHKQFNFFSGYTFDVNSKLLLTGICDFLLTLRTNKPDITAPVFCLVEAKNRTVDEGFGQCAAEMYAAKL